MCRFLLWKCKFCRIVSYSCPVFTVLYCAPYKPHVIYGLSGATASSPVSWRRLRHVCSAAPARPAPSFCASSYHRPRRATAPPLASPSQRARALPYCLRMRTQSLTVWSVWPLSQMSSLSPHWCDTQEELITASSPSCSSASDTRQLSADSLQLSCSYLFLVFINRKKSSIFHHNWDRLHKKGIQSLRSTGTLHLWLLHTFFEYFNRIC